MIASPRLTAFLTSLLLLSASSDAHAQAHQSRGGACSIRSSTVDSRSIPPAVAAARGFSAAADVAIVNVTVRCKGGRRNGNGNGTVPAKIAVTRRDAVGTREAVEMHLDRQNGYVSYYGTYPRVAGAVLTLTVAATPKGASRPIVLSYRHRFAAR